MIAGSKNGSNLRQRALCERIILISATKSLLSDFIKKISKGKKYLRASFSGFVPQKAYQLIS